MHWELRAIALVRWQLSFCPGKEQTITLLQESEYSWLPSVRVASLFLLSVSKTTVTFTREVIIQEGFR